MASPSRISLSSLSDSPDRPPIPPRSWRRPSSNRQSKIEVEDEDAEQLYASPHPLDLDVLHRYFRSLATEENSGHPSPVSAKSKGHQRYFSDEAPSFDPSEASKSEKYQHNRSNSAGPSALLRDKTLAPPADIPRPLSERSLDARPGQAEPARAARATVRYFRSRSASNQNSPNTKEGSRGKPERDMGRRESAPSTYGTRKASNSSQGSPMYIMPVMKEEDFSPSSLPEVPTNSISPKKNRQTASLPPIPRSTSQATNSLSRYHSPISPQRQDFYDNNKPLPTIPANSLSSHRRAPPPLRCEPILASPKTTQTLPPTPPATPPTLSKKSSLRGRSSSASSPLVVCEDALKRMFGSASIAPATEPKKDSPTVPRVKARAFSYTELPPTVRRKFMSPSDAALAMQQEKLAMIMNTRPETPQYETIRNSSDSFRSSPEVEMEAPIYYDHPETRKMLRMLKKEGEFDEIVRNGFNGGAIVTMKVTISAVKDGDEIECS